MFKSMVRAVLAGPRGLENGSIWSFWGRRAVTNGPRSARFSQEAGSNGR